MALRLIPKSEIHFYENLRDIGIVSHIYERSRTIFENLLGSERRISMLVFTLCSMASFPPFTSLSPSSFPHFFLLTDGKVYYMKLSWDMDNAVAYIYRDRLITNKDTDVFKRALREGFSVDKVSSQQKMILTIQVVRLEYKDLKVTCLVKDDDGRGAVIHKETTALKVIGEF